MTCPAFKATSTSFKSFSSRLSLCPEKDNNVGKAQSERTMECAGSKTLSLIMMKTNDNGNKGLGCLFQFLLKEHSYINRMVVYL